LKTPLSMWRVRDRPLAAHMSSGCAHERQDAAGCRKYSRTSGPNDRSVNSARLSRSSVPSRPGSANARVFLRMNR
jgi:hypothetical protein